MTARHDGRTPASTATRWARRIATCGGLGDRLPAPGTLAGSLPAAVAWWGCGLAVGDSAWLLGGTAAATVAATAAGVWAAGVEARRRGREDPGAVVVDEVAGQWLACLAASVVAPATGALGLGRVAVAAFLLFRVLDVVKPWPICRLEDLPGGVGIVADDLAAGAVAGILAGAGLRLLT